MPSILITGANRGLGLEFAKQYAADGWRVLATCRDPDSADELNALAGASSGLITLHKVSIGDHASIEALANELKGQPIDILLNNAGTYGHVDFPDNGIEVQSFGKMDYESWSFVLAINTMAPLKMSEALFENILASDQKKIFTISSTIGSIADCEGMHYAYGSSKAAVNFLMASMAKDLRDQGVTVMPLHPGWVETGMGGETAPVQPEDSIAGLKKVMDNASLETSGQFIGFDGATIPW
ncbi:MAG: SDR family oxidoreductase [Alphaproteobacteria bacterium]